VLDAGSLEPVALAQLRDRDRRRPRLQRVREREPLRDARGDRDRPVRTGRDHAVDPLGLGEPVERGLVLARDQRAPVGERERRSGRIAVGRDHDQAALARGLEQP
jgi:hypothetical protein